jgi:hypothetical protein
MSSRVVLSILMLVSTGAFGAQPDAPKYTPQIRGQLMNGKQPATLNVCLRQSGSEIRMCGYPDFAGQFLIPSSGPLHSVPAKEGEDGRLVSPTYWLEIGRVGQAQKLWPIDPVSDKSAAIEIDCDIARGTGTANGKSGSCQLKTATPIAKNSGSRDRLAGRPSSSSK